MFKGNSLLLHFLAMAALTFVPDLFSAVPKSGIIPVSAINHMVIHVSDMERSMKWYQGLFGLSVAVRMKDSVVLQVGSGRRFLMLKDVQGVKPGIARIGFAPKGTVPVNSFVMVKPLGGSSARWAKGEMEFNDPAGIEVEISNHNGIKSPTSTRGKGLLPLVDYNHFTVFVPDAKANVGFYQGLFDLRIDTYQGPMPIIRVGAGNQFLAFVGGRSEAFVHHACFVVEKFDPDRILGLLAKHGIKPRENKRGPFGPLRSYVVMRMPNRGGAPGGTPELYLTDPDGVLLQLQDVRYSGGGGYLGDKRGMSNRAK